MQTGLQAGGIERQTALAAPPDVATVVPFTLYHGFILFEAAVDGRRGLYVLDTGSPVLTLNRQYLRPRPGVDAPVLPPKRRYQPRRRDAAPPPSLDTAGAITAAPGGMERERVIVTVHDVRVGTLTRVLPDTNVGPPMPSVAGNAVVMHDERFGILGHPVLGLFGLNAIEPFETIIDYPRRHLIFIALDAAGRRVAAVPEYVAAGTVPLVPIADWAAPRWARWWGVLGSLLGERDTAPDTLMLDTGNPVGSLGGDTRLRIGEQLTPITPGDTIPGARVTPQVRLTRLQIGGRVLDSLPFTADGTDDVVGYSYLSRLGVVGLNLRTRQFLWYR